MQPKTVFKKLFLLIKNIFILIKRNAPKLDIPRKSKVILYIILLFVSILSFFLFGQGLTLGNHSLLFLISIIVLVIFKEKSLIFSALFLFLGLALPYISRVALSSDKYFAYSKIGLIKYTILLIVYLFIALVLSIIFRKIKFLRYKKELVITALTIMLLAVVFDTNIKFGNPLMYTVSRHMINNYVTSNFKDETYNIKSLEYSEEMGRSYVAEIESEKDKTKKYKVYFKYSFPIKTQIQTDYQDIHALEEKQKSTEVDLKNKIQEKYPKMEVMLKMMKRQDIRDVLKNNSTVPSSAEEVYLDLRIRNEEIKEYEIATILTKINEIVVKSDKSKVIKGYNISYFDDEKEIEYRNITRKTVESDELEKILLSAKNKGSYTQENNQIIVYDVFYK